MRGLAAELNVELERVELERGALRAELQQSCNRAATELQQSYTELERVELERDALRAELEEEACARSAAEKRSERATSLQVAGLALNSV